MPSLSRLIPLLALAGALAAGAVAQPAIQPTVDITKVPEAAQPSAHFDAEAATEAYMNMIPPAATARSNAYFEGGYWLILWDFLVGVVIALILLETRWSAKMRALAARITRFRWLQDILYWIQYLLITSVLGFPMGFYEGYVREHKYGLATQTFGPWMGDQFKGLLIGLVMGAVIVPILFGIVRWLPRTWWLLGATVMLVFTMVSVAIGPVYLQPIFNKITKLNDPKVTAPILRLARANGIPTDDVYQIDASRQTTRMSANVSGFAGTTRVTLNDNLLRRGSQEEIEAVMGHEMGHYVLNHIPHFLIEFSILMVLTFWILYWSLGWALKNWGGRWGVDAAGDVAVLPLAMLAISVLFFVLTPVTNTMTRTQEKEADMFGLNAARQPDGFAQAAIHLSEYRKMRPGKWEEIFFFDHPSGYDRIHSAMVWKSQNLQLFEAPAPAPAPALPQAAATAAGARR